MRFVFWNRLEEQRRASLFFSKLLCLLKAPCLPVHTPPSCAVAASGPQLHCGIQKYPRPAAPSPLLSTLFLLPTSSATPLHPSLPSTTSLEPPSSHLHAASSPSLLPPPPTRLSPSLSHSLLPPPPPPPSSLLRALAGLLLTEESLDLGHPLCLALSRKKEGNHEGPRPPEGRCPLEGGVGRARGGEAGTVAEAICPRINSLLFPVSLSAWDLGQGPVCPEGTGWVGRESQEQLTYTGYFCYSGGPRCWEALWGVKGGSGVAHSPCGAST